MESQSPHSLSRKVLRGDIPHILEHIFLYLDYESLKTCFEVGKDWRKILKSKSFQNKMVIIYWTCGEVAKVAIIVTVRSQMEQNNHLASSRKFDFPEM